MFMSTPDHAWQILSSDTETDVSSYYVTLPTDLTRQMVVQPNIQMMFMI